MKKLLLVLIFLQSINLQAIFVEIQDSSQQNRFLGADITSCSTSGYGCGNDTISSILNVDFFSPKMYGKQLYIFNDFVYWIGDQYKGEEYTQTVLRFSGSQLDDKIKKDYPAPGTYMIVLGTTDYLKTIIAPTKTCPPGQWLMMAQLKYNNGNMIYTWSQDAICLAPHDQFIVQVSSDVDTTMTVSSGTTKKIPTVDPKGINWMKDPGPDAIYLQAKNAPRKIRLIKKGS